MKILFLSAFILVSNMVMAYDENPIKSIPAVEEVSWALESSQWDYDQAMAISFEENVSNDNLMCFYADSIELVNLFKKAISQYREYYPDEDLPYAPALREMKKVLADKKLEYCFLEDSVEKNWQIYLDGNILISISQ